MTSLSNTDSSMTSSQDQAFASTAIADEPWDAAAPNPAHLLSPKGPSRRPMVRKRTLSEAGASGWSNRYIDWAVIAITVLVALSVATAKAGSSSVAAEGSSFEVVFKR